MMRIVPSALGPYRHLEHCTGGANHYTYYQTNKLSGQNLLHSNTKQHYPVPKIMHWRLPDLVTQGCLVSSLGMASPGLRTATALPVPATTSHNNAYTSHVLEKPTRANKTANFLLQKHTHTHTHTSVWLIQGACTMSYSAGLDWEGLCQTCT